jgi:hypothetical protein
MPVVLSPNVQEEIFEKVKTSFVDFTLFDQLVAKQLKQAISDSNNIDIDAKSVRKLTEKYFDSDSFKTEQQKLLLTQIQLILRTAYVVILSYHENIQPLLWKDVSTLLEHYPQFQGQEEDELRYLLNFRNFLRVALIIIPARLNKQLLLKIAAKLEGSRNEYITGGGQKPCVTRRVEIYEQEGNIQPEKRQDRIRPPKIPGKKRSGNQTLKDLKLLRLPSEEVRALTKAPSEHEKKSKSHKHHAHAPAQQMPPHHAQPPMHFYPPYHPMYSGVPTFMDFPQPNFTNIVPPNGFPGFFDDSVVTESMDDLLAFNCPPGHPGALPPGEALPLDFSYMPPPMHPYGAYPPMAPPPHSNANPSNGGTQPGGSASGNTTSSSSGSNSAAVPPQTANGNMPPPPLPSSQFPPVLSREQSELIDRLLLPESEFWAANNPENANHPLALMRNISWDIYNGTFGDDLKNILGPEW